MPAELEVKQGDVFGKLCIIEELGSRREKRIFLCLCECGTICTTMLYKMRSGATKSCGHLKRSGTHVTHGLTRRRIPPEYKIWTGIKSRCFNANTPAYIRYGGRGITMAREWQYNYEIFFTYVGSRPSPIHSIDRFPNGNGNYEPGNVRWATTTEQARNRNKTTMLTFNGQTKSLMEWAEIVGIGASVIRNRLNQGWDVVAALSVRKRQYVELEVPKPSRFKGVYWDKNKRRWAANIYFGNREDGRKIIVFLGRFGAEEEAARAYDIAALDMFGSTFPTNGLEAA